MSPERNMNNPYVGPRPFERNEDDSVRFFGRTQETQEIVSLIFGHPILLVYAQSGAGKTSLFNASIATTLEDDGFDVLPITRVRGGVPENISIEETKNLYIFNAILNMEPEADPQAFVTKTLTSYLETRPRENDESGQPVPRVLIFDQFEELFTVTTQDWLEQRKSFFHQITEALTVDPLLRVVLVIREDFLAQLDPYVWILPERLRTRYRLERLQENAALQAIKAPLSGTTRSFAPDVAESLVKELLFMRTVNTAGEMTEIAGQYVEPVQLQVVCLTLWSSLPPDCTVITQEHLKGFDVSVALSDFYKTAIQAVVQNTGVEEANVRNWFGKTLITPMETRSTVYQSEDTTGGIPNNAVDLLEGRHLIRAEYRAGVRWYELTHDRFIEAILADNEEWFIKRRETLRNPIATTALDWDRLGKDEGSLLQGAILDEANAWVQNHPNELNDLELSFLRASQEHYQRDLESKAKRARTFRALTIALAIALVIVGFATGYALKQSNTARMAEATAQAALADEAVARADAEDEKAKADKERDRAIAAEAEARAGQLALQAINKLESDPQLSLLLAIESVNESHTFEADDALRQALEASLLWDLSNGEAQKTLREHDTAIWDVEFDSSGDWLISRSEDATNIWDFSAIRDVEIRDVNETKIDNIVLDDFGGDGYHGLELNPDVNILALDTTDKEGGSIVSILDVSNLPNQSIKEKDSKDFPGQAILNMAFNNDGSMLAIIGRTKNQFIPDETIWVWNTSDDSIEGLSQRHRTYTRGVVFNPDGSLLATSGSDLVLETGVIQLWDVPAILDGNDKQDPVSQILSQATLFNTVFTLDGQTLISGSRDGTIRFWDVSNSTERAVLRGHEGAVYGLSLSSDGHLLASGDGYGNVRLWDVDTALSTGGSNAEKSVLRGHRGPVRDVAFSPNGRWLVSASDDKTIRLWMIDPGKLVTVACQYATRNFTQDEVDTYFEGNIEYNQTCTNLPIHSSVIDAMIEQGDEYARQGKRDDALSKWKEANDLDPQRKLDPDKKLAQVFMDLGKNQLSAKEVNQEIVNQALENLRKAAELDPTLNIEPEQIVANELRDLVFHYITVGELEEAYMVLEQAVKLDPTLKEQNIDTVINLYGAAQEEYPFTVTEYKEALKVLNFYLTLYPRSITDSITRSMLKVTYGQRELIGPDEINVVLAFLELAVELNPKIEIQQAAELIDTYTWICRLGALYEYSETVLPTCQSAVELAEVSGYNSIGIVRDSRGLAQTMTGDYAGAIKDFEFFIQWARANNLSETLISQRETWIVMLGDGQNPFEEDPDLILIIREQLFP